MMASARESRREASVPGTSRAATLRPATLARRDWIHQWSSSSQTPASGAIQRELIVSTMVAIARSSSVLRWSCRPAAA